MLGRLPSRAAWPLAAALVASAAVALALAGPGGLWRVLGAALLEETVFRAGLHEAALRTLAAQPSAPQRAMAAINLGLALLFAAAHAASQPIGLAAATALPALLIGALYQRWRSTAACVLAHALANLVWLVVAGHATALFPALPA